MDIVPGQVAGLTNWTRRPGGQCWILSQLIHRAHCGTWPALCHYYPESSIVRVPHFSRVWQENYHSTKSRRVQDLRMEQTCTRQSPAVQGVA